ncbi:SpoIIE family protein phosphatase [Poriferisphaera sp. WC338]|uniref:SpoIIE family protein phosphatase n=1 Tax=Poriferisphaera sp. WC338 TaxID=3425129 RepID=UPI003D816EFC
MSQTDTQPPAPSSDDPATNLAATQLSLTPKLTDFLDLATLQEIQDAFTAATRLQTTIVAADGSPITAPTNTPQRDASNAALAHLISPEDLDHDTVTAPIMLEGKHIASINITPGTPDADETATENPPSPCSGTSLPATKHRKDFIALTQKLGLTPKPANQLLCAFDEALASQKAAAIQLLYQLASAITRLCYEEYQARLRARELSALYKLSSNLSNHQQLDDILEAAVHAIADILAVKAVSIRLLDKDDDTHLVPRAVHNLSPEYLTKGKIQLDTDNMFHDAISGQTVYVKDMTTDPRVLFPGDAASEGLASMLAVGITYQSKPIGTIQLFTAATRDFSHYEIHLTRAIADLLASAIETAQLQAQRKASRNMMRQIQLAASVQRRMLPKRTPKLPNIDIAARYIPSLDLAGDFYDFIHLDTSLGLAIGDAVGKGVAASLLMSSVRASLRAFAQDLYDLDEIMTRVNNALCRDTLDSEFATLWYGTLDPNTLRLTYASAGHDPPLLLRNGTIHQLDTGGMIVGVLPDTHYDKGLFDLEPGDTLLLYTDGLTDAFNPDQQKFGRTNLERALTTAAQTKHTAADILNHILWELRQHTQTHPATDDVTLITLRVTD